MSNLAAVPKTKAKAPASRKTGGASPERLRAVIEAAPVALGLLDPDGTVRAWNQAALALLGAAQLADVRGHRLEEFVAEEHAAAVQALLASVCAGTPGTLQYEVTLPDGGRRWVETRGVPLAREGSSDAAFLAASWDVTAQRAIAEAAEQAGTGSAALAEAQARLAELERERAAWTTGRAEWANEREGLSGQIRQLESQMAALRGDLETQRETHRAALEERERAHAAVLAQRSGEAESAAAALRTRYEQSLEEARAERDTLRAEIQQWEQRATQTAGTQRAEREAFETRLRALQEQASSLQQTLETERDSHRETLEAERARSQERLHAVEARVTAAEHELEAERDLHRLTLDDLERAHESALAAQQRDADSASRTQRTRYEQQLADVQSERDELRAGVRDWEQRYQQTLDSRRVEREEFEDALRAASARADELRETQDAWRREFSRTLEGLVGITDRATALLTRTDGKASFADYRQAHVSAWQAPAPAIESVAPHAADESEQDVESESVEVTPWEF